MLRPSHATTSTKSMCENNDNPTISVGLVDDLESERIRTPGGSANRLAMLV